MLASTIALDRFGLGGRPDEPTPSDPKKWLLEQLGRFEPRPLAFAQVPARADAGGRASSAIISLAQQTAARAKRAASKPASAPDRTLQAAAATPGRKPDPDH